MKKTNIVESCGFLGDFVKDKTALIVVEATILFPVIFMIFAGLVLLAIYLPIRATLQRATQHAAAVMATEKSDTWIKYDESRMEYDWDTTSGNIYTSLFNKTLSGADEKKAQDIIMNMEGDTLIKNLPPEKLSIDSHCVNYYIYKEIVVTAKYKLSMPTVLTFVSFPEELVLTVTSTAVVQNAEEFIRNMDIFVDVLDYMGIDVSKVGDLFDSVTSLAK